MYAVCNSRCAQTGTQPDPTVRAPRPLHFMLQDESGSATQVHRQLSLRVYSKVATLPKVRWNTCSITPIIQSTTTIYGYNLNTEKSARFARFGLALAREEGRCIVYEKKKSLSTLTEYMSFLLMRSTSYDPLCHHSIPALLTPQL